MTRRTGGQQGSYIITAVSFNACSFPATTTAARTACYRLWNTQREREGSWVCNAQSTAKVIIIMRAKHNNRVACLY